MKKRKFLSIQEKTEILNKYITGKYTCNFLAREYNVSKTPILNLLKKSNISILNNKSQLKRQYSLQENYFNEINTEAKAYFLGLLYADGYHHEDRNSIVLSLIESDKDILEKFNIELESNKPLQLINKRKYNKNWENQLRLNINSPKISQSLKLLGCTNNKTFNLKFPKDKQIPTKLIRHFIRGYFDGDGSLGLYYKKGRKNPVLSVSIVSTQQFCEKLSKLLKNILKINTYISYTYNKTNNIRSMYISGKNQILKFLHWIYQNANVFLNRKYNKYLEYSR